MRVPAHKNQKHRGVLIAIRAVVISSEVEKSLLQYGNQHVCAIPETMSWCCVFLLSRNYYLPVCNKDRGLRSG